MCARRFLLLILVLILIAVAGAFAIFQWGGNVLIKTATPQGHFEAAAAGGAPDYREQSSWLARPGMPNDPTAWLPDGTASEAVGRAAVFYVHPTTYLKRDRWNAPLDVPGETDFRTNLFAQSQASALNGVGEVWAPKYRQAAFGAFLLDSADAQKALDFAYRDVAAAFDEFVKEAGDRPIILAGHSQGALHLERLLREKIAGTAISRRVVAAYVVGWPIDAQSDLPMLGLPACTSADQPGCILSWMTFKDPANPDLILKDWEKTAGLNGGKRRKKQVVCVNPVSGIDNGAAPASDNPGTLVPTVDLRSAMLTQGAVGAECRDGLLIATGEIPPLGPYVLPGNNYHVYDYALFWGAIRRDALRRLAAWHR